MIDSAGKPFTKYYKTREQDLAVMRNMLDAAKTRSLTLFFNRSDSSGNGIDSVWYALRDIELSITLRQPEITYQTITQGSDTRVLLVKNNGETWRISRWIDGTSGESDDQ